MRQLAFERYNFLVADHSDARERLLVTGFKRPKLAPQQIHTDAELLGNLRYVRIGLSIASRLNSSLNLFL